MYHWPGPRSLATTNGVSFDVLSSGYLDVSVPRVRLKPPILFRDLIPSFDNGNPKPENLAVLGSQNSVIEGGFPHSEIRGSKLLRSSSRLIAA